MLTTRRIVMLVLICVCVLVGCDAIQNILQDPTTPDKIKAGGDAVEQFVPAPWNLAVGLASGMIVLLLRSWQNKRAAKVLVKRIEKAKTAEGVVDFTSQEAKVAMASIVNPTADKLVDKLQAGKFVLPF